MKTRLPITLAAAMALLTTSAVQAEATNRDQQRQDQKRVVLQNHGRSGYHVRVERKSGTVAWAVERSAKPRFKLQCHGRAGYRYVRTNG